MDTRARLEALLAERIVVLDGAWGVLLQSRGLSEDDFRGERFAGQERDLKGDPDVLNLTQPGIVSEIHRAYLDAGADAPRGERLAAHLLAALELLVPVAKLLSPELPAEDLLRPPEPLGHLGLVALDDQVDALNAQIFRELLTYMVEDPRNIPRALALLLTARSLERIGDHATNICEEVIYVVKGQDVRHQESIKHPPAGS